MKTLITLLTAALFSGTPAVAQVTPKQFTPGAAATSLGYSPLSPALNLSEVTAPATARANLHVIGVSPLDYGAKCDGSTDDTSALQAMFAAGTTDNLVYDFPGMCAFSAALVVPTKNYVTLNGHGTGGFLWIGAAVVPGASFTGSIIGNVLTIISGTGPALGDMLSDGGVNIPSDTVFVQSKTDSTHYQITNPGQKATPGGVVANISALSVTSEAMTSVPPALRIGAPNNGLHNYALYDLRVRSSTVMTAGWAVEVNSISPADIANLDVGAAGVADSNWYNAILFAGGKYEHVRGLHARAHNIAEALTAQFVTNASILDFSQDGQSLATHSQIGIVIGGGCGGCTFDQTDAVGNGTNVLIAQTFANTPNLGLFIGKDMWIDGTDVSAGVSTGNGVGLQIADPGNPGGVHSTLSAAGAWLSFAENQCLLVNATALYWNLHFTGGFLNLCGQAGNPLALATARIDVAGTGYTGSGTLTWTGGNCTTNPVLAVTQSGGAIATATVQTVGVCTVWPIPSASNWAVGGSLTHPSGTNAQLSYLPAGAIDNESTSANVNIQLDGVAVLGINTSFPAVFNASGANEVLFSGVNFADFTLPNVAGAWVGTARLSNGRIVFASAVNNMMIQAASGFATVVCAGSVAASNGLWVKNAQMFPGKCDGSTGNAGAVTLGSASFPFGLAYQAGTVFTPYTIAGLPTCNSTNVSTEAWINNGIAAPTYRQAVSSTGSAVEPVYCIYNGTSYGWAY